VFEFRDEFLPKVAGTYELVVTDGIGRCAPTEAEAELVGTINVLGATYLGGATFGQLARAGRVQERSGGALVRADALFASQPAPWCPMHF
jgi:predicted acetyltransferase